MPWFRGFIISTILDQVKNGSLLVWGKVGSVQSPHLVLTLSVEPTKPRMCHNERFLDLWMKDLPLSPEYSSGLPRYVFKSHFQTTFENKSGYDHVKLSPVGLEFRVYLFIFYFIIVNLCKKYLSCNLIKCVKSKMPLSWPYIYFN